MGGLARLVVLDDPARAERVEIDAVDLPGEGERPQVEPALELRRGPLGPERDLELARHELKLRRRFVPDELLQVAQQALLELTSLELGQLHPDAVHRLGEALP